MTTAHRPTWHAAMGGEDQGGNRLVGNTAKISSKDLPAHKKLKIRAQGQGSKEELMNKKFKEELIHKEKQYLQQNKAKEGLLAVAEGSSYDRLAELSDIQYENPFPEDADDEPLNKKNKYLKNNSDDSCEETDDDEADLMKELEKIKKEREEEELKKLQEKEKEKDEERRQKTLRGNPLLIGDGGGAEGVKKRWDDDVVFKNQAKNTNAKKRSFINDTVRSDFHKKFLLKYIH